MWRIGRPLTMTRIAAALAIVLVAAACSAPSVTPAPSVAPAPSAVAGSSFAPIAPIAPVESVVPALRPVGLTELARVVRVVDGDTLVIDRGFGNERLRYIGMDTPESVKPGSPIEFMGREASAANAALVDGREVVLETDVSDTDRFGRLLRYVWLREGDGWVLVNLELVRRGFAQAASFPPDVRWQDEFRQAQRDAREAGLGLWGRATPAP